mgnify:CR=1 FL=1
MPNTRHTHSLMIVTGLIVLFSECAYAVEHSDVSGQSKNVAETAKVGDMNFERANTLSPEKKMELRQYFSYEHREPCQNYREAPQPFVKHGCNTRWKRKKEQPMRHAAQHESAPAQEPLRDVIANYTINFDHDRYNIRPSEQATVDRIFSEIKRYEPYEVTIAGYADRSGPADYNMTLSQKRAQSVSEALTSAGIPNRVLDEKSFGESNLAIPTPDGMRLEANRRVVVQFRK